MISLNKLLQWLILTLLFPLVFLNGWLIFRIFEYFQPLVTTIVIATLLAFILNYLVSILQRRGVKRNLAVTLVFLLTLVILVALGITLIPIVLQQFHEIVTILPHWIDSSEQKFKILNDWSVSHHLKVNFAQIINQLTDRLPDEVEFITDKLFSIFRDTIDSVSEALITVVLTFYLLADGEKLWFGIFKKLPASFEPAKESIQRNFQNFLIGQVVLALLMGVSLTTMFLILKVQFGLLFGLGIGILSLIPFGDVVSLAAIALIIASHDFWLAVKVLSIAVVIDQIIDQAIAPRLLGKFTGLRPVWVLISLLVGTYVGGLLGLLIAVPLAGFIKDAFDGWGMVPGDALEGDEDKEMLAKESGV